MTAGLANKALLIDTFSQDLEKKKAKRNTIAIWNESLLEQQIVVPCVDYTIVVRKICAIALEDLMVDWLAGRKTVPNSETFII